jgi:hypothetical protein
VKGGGLITYEGWRIVMKEEGSLLKRGRGGGGIMNGGKSHHHEGLLTTLPSCSFSYDERF